MSKIKSDRTIEYNLQDPVNKKDEFIQVIASPIDPIETIKAEGEMYDKLSEGIGPWWVIVSSWLLYVGLPIFTVIIGIIAAQMTGSPDKDLMSAAMLSVLIIPYIYYKILISGTKKKLGIEDKDFNNDTRRKRINVNENVIENINYKLNYGKKLTKQLNKETKKATILYVAIISKISGIYFLKISKGSREIAAEEFENIVDLATYLYHNTSFRINDFYEI